MKNKIEVREDGLYLNDEKFFLLSGDFHYFRTNPDGWKRRLILMRDFGLTAVTTYVAWNIHEAERGKYNFSGIADLPRFLEECQVVGLKVILRCSPYMCSEWDLGGLPSWLLKDRTICLRSSDPAFMEPVSEYFKVLGEKIKPYMFTNGGPIILAGLENEYGSFGNDKLYLKKLGQLYRDCGIDVPFISANGSDPFKYKNGTLDEAWNGIDCPTNLNSVKEIELLTEYQPNKLPMVGEAWVGNMQIWGINFSINSNIEQAAVFFERALNMNACINFYMFCGGTNFGFTAGSLATLPGEGLHPMQTSYDYDAPISEEGVPREKYFVLRDVLDKYLGKEPRPHTIPVHNTQSVENVELTDVAPLFENLDNLCGLHTYKQRTVSMEDLDQASGFILYESRIEYTDDRLRHLYLYDVADRATVYLNGKYIGAVQRDCKAMDINFYVPKCGAKLSILVENMGHIFYGYKIYDYKGLLGAVRFGIENSDGTMLYNFANLMGFDIYTLPLDNIEKLEYKNTLEVKKYDGMPVFMKGIFSATPGVDTFIDTKGLVKGLIYVNGFNLGRYWEIGPQRTLYVPGEIIKDHNTVEIFELHGQENLTNVSFIDHALLTEPVNNTESESNNFFLL